MNKVSTDKLPAKKKKTVLIIAGAAAVVIVALVVVVVVLLLRPSAPPPAAPPDTGTRGVVAVPENVEELREKVDKPVEDGYYETRMNTEWVFDTWDTPSKNAKVENALANTRTVYFDLRLKETDELVYSSPFIPVGATLEGFALDREVPPGEHAASVTYTLVDDDGNDITTLSVSIKLFILA